MCHTTWRHLRYAPIDRIMADDSEWRDLWQDAAGGDTNAAFDTVRGLRMVLSALREVA